MSWKVHFFQTTRGDFPVKDFLFVQEKLTQAKMMSYIDLLENSGPFLKPPYCKKLQGKLYELRVIGKVSVRIFYTIKDSEYYLLHAFHKKTNKTPINELKVALDRVKIII